MSPTLVCDFRGEVDAKSLGRVRIITGVSHDVIPFVRKTTPFSPVYSCASLERQNGFKNTNHEKRQDGFSNINHEKRHEGFSNIGREKSQL